MDTSKKGSGVSAKMKITDLSEAQLSKAIAEKRWPEYEWSLIHDRLYRRKSQKFAPELISLNCTIPNDIFPIWAELWAELHNALCKYVYTKIGADPETEMLEATKSTRAMSELILWYYVGCPS